MKKYKYKVLITLVVLLAQISFADQFPHSLGSTPHIKEILYDPNGLHIYTGFFGYQSSIVFEQDETIDTVSMGDSTGWQMNPQGNRLFLKPTEDNCTTNVTIITNKRIYHFLFRGKDAKDVTDPELAYELRFKYPSNDFSISKGNANSPHKNGSDDPSDPLNIASKPYVNFEYTLSGKDYIKPLKVFDDGVFTYFEFPRDSQYMPSIFLVDSEGYEALINYHLSGPYMVVEQVSERFTLRYGKDYVCVFNQAFESSPYTRDIRNSRNNSSKRKGIFGHGKRR